MVIAMSANQPIAEWLDMLTPDSRCVRKAGGSIYKPSIHGCQRVNADSKDLISAMSLGDVLEARRFEPSTNENGNITVPVNPQQRAVD